MFYPPPYTGLADVVRVEVGVLSYTLVYLIRRHEVLWIHRVS